jgi:hypothetical protein
MARHKKDRYPRLNSERKVQDGKHPICKPCRQLGQEAEAVTYMRVEFTYMRGEDEVTPCCADHRSELLDLLKHRHKPWPKHFQGGEVWS